MATLDKPTPARAQWHGVEKAQGVGHAMRCHNSARPTAVSLPSDIRNSF